MRGHDLAKLLIGSLLMIGLPLPGQQNLPTLVQPGAPGAPTKTLPSSTRASKEVVSRADVDFMRGMIMHHSQAVEMTSLIESRSHDKAMLELGKRISLSQSDEIKWMRCWLEARGQTTDTEMPGMSGMTGMNRDQSMMPLIPGMLTPQQMQTLRQTNGKEFDRIFLAGMVQHHRGALVMVKELFNTAGAGQGAELFDFSTDVDNTQRAEINLMEKMLKEIK